MLLLINNESLLIMFLCMISAFRYRQWEKVRRAKFNSLLLDLATVLPGYEVEGKERGNTTLKWSKAEVVEKATAYIRALEEVKVAGEVARRVRATRKQNKYIV